METVHMTSKLELAWQNRKQLNSTSSGKISTSQLMDDIREWTGEQLHSTEGDGAKQGNMAEVHTEMVVAVANPHRGRSTSE